ADINRPFRLLWGREALSMRGACQPRSPIAMSWVTFLWSMVSTASLTLAAVHLPMWVRNRTASPSFFFSLMALATAAFAFCELQVMHAETPGEFADAVRWA